MLERKNERLFSLIRNHHTIFQTLDSTETKLQNKRHTGFQITLIILFNKDTPDHLHCLDMI
jgi:hypothetical protein